MARTEANRARPTGRPAPTCPASAPRQVPDPVPAAEPDHAGHPACCPEPARPADDGGWARYWRDPGRPVEAMYAHFLHHTFARHSHDAYSFAVTELGAQRFRCRGALRTSGAGMVMALNPDDPHDGEAASELGYRYRIVHIGPDTVRDVLADAADGPAVLPLFDRPVLTDPALARALVRLYAVLVEGAGPLARDERLTAVVTAMVRRTASRPPRARTLPAGGRGQAAVARRARALLVAAHEEACRAPSVPAVPQPAVTPRSAPPGRLGQVPAAPAAPAAPALGLTGRATSGRSPAHTPAVPGQVSADRLAEAAGCSRYALYRAFHAEYGMAPSDFQRQLRLRRARELLVSGRTAAEAAAEAGFADQSHLHRWFVRCFGVTPGTYQRSAGRPASAPGA